MCLLQKKEKLTSTISFHSAFAKSDTGKVSAVRLMLEVLILKVKKKEENNTIFVIYGVCDHREVV